MNFISYIYLNENIDKHIQLKSIEFNFFLTKTITLIILKTITSLHVHTLINTIIIHHHHQIKKYM